MSEQKKISVYNIHQVIKTVGYRKLPGSLKDAYRDYVRLTGWGTNLVNLFEAPALKTKIVEIIDRFEQYVQERELLEDWPNALINLKDIVTVENIFETTKQVDFDLLPSWVRSTYYKYKYYINFKDQEKEAIKIPWELAELNRELSEGIADVANYLNRMNRTFGGLPYRKVAGGVLDGKSAKLVVIKSLINYYNFPDVYSYFEQDFVPFDLDAMHKIYYESTNYGNDVTLLVKNQIAYTALDLMFDFLIADVNAIKFEPGFRPTQLLTGNRLLTVDDVFHYAPRIETKRFPEDLRKELETLSVALELTPLHDMDELPEKFVEAIEVLAGRLTEIMTLIGLPLRDESHRPLNGAKMRPGSLGARKQSDFAEQQVTIFNYQDVDPLIDWNAAEAHFKAGREILLQATDNLTDVEKLVDNPIAALGVRIFFDLLEEKYFEELKDTPLGMRVIVGQNLETEKILKLLPAVDFGKLKDPYFTSMGATLMRMFAFGVFVHFDPENPLVTNELKKFCERFNLYLDTIGYLPAKPKRGSTKSEDSLQGASQHTAGSGRGLNVFNATATSSPMYSPALYKYFPKEQTQEFNDAASGIFVTGALRNGFEKAPAKIKILLRLVKDVESFMKSHKVLKAHIPASNLVMPRGWSVPDWMDIVGQIDFSRLPTAAQQFQKSLDLLHQKKVLLKRYGEDAVYHICIKAYLEEMIRICQLFGGLPMLERTHKMTINLNGSGKNREVVPEINSGNYFLMMQEIDTSLLPESLKKIHEDLLKRLHSGSPMFALTTGLRSESKMKGYLKKLNHFIVEHDMLMDYRGNLEGTGKKRHNSPGGKFLENASALIAKENVTRKALLQFLESLQTAIAKKEIRKSDPHAGEIMALQRELISILKKDRNKQPLVTPELEKLANQSWEYLDGIEEGAAHESDNVEPVVNGAESFLFGIEPAQVAEQQEKFPPVMSAGEMAQQESDAYHFTGFLKDAFGEPEKNFALMLYGEPGGGKTILSLWLAKHFAENFGNVLYVAAEQYPKGSLTRRINEMKIGDVQGIDFTKSLDHPEVNVELYDLIIIDSANSHRLTPEGFRELQEKYPGKAFVVLLQTLKNGNYRGSREWEHDTDIVAKVENRKISVSKTRFDTQGEVDIPDLLKQEDSDDTAKEAA